MPEATYVIPYSRDLETYNYHFFPQQRLRNQARHVTRLDQSQLWKIQHGF